MGKENKAEEAPETIPHQSKEGRSHPKISRLSLAEIEQELERVQKHMGGLTSKHAQFLLEQRHHLIQHASHPAQLKKAA